MKLSLRTLLLITLITPVSLVMAHSDHGAINDDTAVQIAHKAVQQMTFKDFGYPVGKLDSSWKSVQGSDVEVIDSNDKFYFLRVTNRETKKSIYFKIAVTGQVLEASESPDN